MKLLRKLTAFILVFSLLAGTVAVISAAVSPDEVIPGETIAPEIPDEYEADSPRSADLADTSATSYTPRLSAPAKTNKYYYSDLNPFHKYGWGMPNCTCYAWGRAYEILGRTPNLSLYSAYLWYGYNKDNKIYSYGTTPKLGAIACWVYSSGTSGHVAVVEKIENGTITFSNSAYSGTTFYTNTAPVNDPSNGNKYWIFQGYIYLGDFVSGGSTTTPSQGSTTGDVYRITSSDGVNLRSGAGTSYKVLGGIGYGKDVTVTKTKKSDGYTWGYTTYNGVTGWFVTDFAKLIYRKTDPTAPTVKPTTAPTVKPTTAPTVKPTAKPTVKPTVKPTEKPTTKPTVKPTTAPKATAAPTAKPTAKPTQAPTRPPQIEETPEEPVRMMMMGDLDGDGDLTIMDATRVQMIVADLMVPTDYMLMVGDFDGDSVFSIMDASSIRIQLAFLDD